MTTEIGSMAKRFAPLITPVPASDRIADVSEALMLHGEYQSGQQLPRAADIAAEFNVSDRTAKAAYAELGRRGLTRSSGRNGTEATAQAQPAPPQVLDAVQRLVHVAAAAQLSAGQAMLLVAAGWPVPELAPEPEVAPEPELLDLSAIPPAEEPFDFS